MSVPWFRLIQGDCLDSLKPLEDNSIDSIVTDSPYGISMMGAKWDYDIPSVEIWKECFRVLKPGGFLLSFASTRTQHRMACRIEDAGFEIRDIFSWVFASGMPKVGYIKDEIGNHIIDGFAGSIKPAFEPITVARKPFKGSLKNNLYSLGTGAYNIDGCRVPLANESDAAEFENNHRVTERLPESSSDKNLGLFGGGWKQKVGEASIPLGRWPANFIHDGSEEVVSIFPEAKGQQGKVSPEFGVKSKVNTYGEFGPRTEFNPRNDSGSAARFFYCAKTSRSDRHEGMKNPGPQFKHGTTLRKIENTDRKGNHHISVKPTNLMRYLVRLVTPPNGTVLDPFNGSGSTGKACMIEGFNYIGMELDPEYIKISESRIQWALDNRDKILKEEAPKETKKVENLENALF